METAKIPKAVGAGKALQEVNGVPHTQPDRALQAYAANRPKFPAHELLKYSGLWIAWSPDATQIIASASSRQELRELICEQNEDPQQCVVERIPPTGITSGSRGG